MGIHEREQFDRDGYLLVREVLTPEQVRWLREFFWPKFDLPLEQRLRGDTDCGLLDIFSRYPEIRWLLFNDRTLNLFKTLAGDDFVVMAECAVTLNTFVHWHKDTSAWEERGHKLHWEPGYRMIGFAYYLQDNSEEYGGGLEVEPGSHNEPDRFVAPQAKPSENGLWQRINAKLRRIAGRTRIEGNGTAPKRAPLLVPNKAGDLVVFHFRLNHRASQPQRFPLPREREKMLITGGITTNNPRFIQDRVDYYYSRDSCFYPKGLSYPADLLHEAKAHGISFCTDIRGRE